MARTSTKSLPKATVGRLATKKQLAEVYQEKFGIPISHRTLERWPLAWRPVNGRAATSVDEFLAEAERRINEAPLIRRGYSLVTKAA